MATETKINFENVLKEIGTMVQDSIRPVEVITIRSAAKRVGRRPDDLKTTIKKTAKQQFNVLRCRDTGTPICIILDGKWSAYETKMKERKA